MSTPVARKGDTSDHGGVIVDGSPTVKDGGLPVARVGDMFSCPIPGHGVNAIVTGSPIFTVDGKRVARTGSKTACGATIIGGSAIFKCE